MEIKALVGKRGQPGENRLSTDRLKQEHTKEARLRLAAELMKLGQMKKSL